MAANNNSKEKELIKREEALNEKEESLLEREKTIIEKEESLAAKEVELNDKETTLLASIKNLENLKEVNAKGLPNITVVGAVRHNVDTRKITPKVGARQTKVLSDGTVVTF